MELEEDKYCSTLELKIIQDERKLINKLYKSFCTLDKSELHARLNFIYYLNRRSRLSKY